MKRDAKKVKVCYQEKRKHFKKSDKKIDTEKKVYWKEIENKRIY